MAGVTVPPPPGMASYPDQPPSGMAYPHQPSAAPYQSLPPVLAPSPYPPQLPPGYGCLSLEFNRGPYLIPAMTTSRFKVDGQDVTHRMREGRWFLPVAAGYHKLKVTDFMGVPIMTTEVTVAPGGTHHRSFRFGGWRNRVRDERGTDVTRFGLWSNYSMMLIGFAVLAVCCVGLITLVVASS